VSRAYVVRGASGDKWGELNGGKGTIGLQGCSAEKAQHATFDFLNPNNNWQFMQNTLAVKRVVCTK
jgi:hypothetical protein